MSIEKLKNQSPLLDIIKSINILIDMATKHEELTSTLTNKTMKNSVIAEMDYNALEKGGLVRIKTAGVYEIYANSDFDLGAVKARVINKENLFAAEIKPGESVNWLLSVDDVIEVTQARLSRPSKVIVQFKESLLAYLEKFRVGIEERHFKLENYINNLENETRNKSEEMIASFDSEIKRIVEEYSKASTAIFTLNEKNKLAGIETGATRIKAGENVEIANGVLSAKVPKKLSEMTDDREYRTVTDSEKEYWNKKWDNADDKDISKALAIINTGVSAWSSPGTPRQVGWWIGDFDKRTRENKEKAEKANQEAVKKLDTSILKYTYGTNSYIGRFGVDANGPYIEEVVIDG